MSNAIGSKDILPPTGRTKMLARCDAGNHHAVVVAVLLLLVTQTVAPAGESPTLVRLLVRGEQSVTTEAGVLLADESGDIRILDLRTGRERTFKKSQIRSVANPATEQDVATVIGIAPLVAWFIAEALPSRPKAGQIASVDGTVAYINRGAAVGLRVGERLDVFRGDGQDIVDPETGDVLGSTQRRIAQVEVIDLRDKLSKVRLAGEFEVNLAIGDVVRPVATEHAVAVLPLGRDSGQLIQGGVQLAEQITSGLAKNGVTVVERTLLEKVLSEQSLAGTGKFDPDTVQRVGKLLQAQAIVTGTIQINGKDANVNVRLIDVETGKVLYATSLNARNLNTAPVRGDALRSAPSPMAAPGLPAGATAELRKLRELDTKTHGVRCIQVSPDGTRALTGGSDKTVRIWNLDTGIDIRQFAGHAAMIRAAVWLPDGLTVVSVDQNGVMKVWSTETGQLGSTLQVGGDVKGLAVIGEGNQIAVGVRQKETARIEIWNLRSKRLVRRFDADVWAVDVSPDGNWIASGGVSGQIELRECRGDRIRLLGSHGQLVTCVRFSADGSLLLTSGFDGAIRIWDTETGEVIDRLPCANDGSDLLLTPTRDYLIATGHGVHLWQMDSRTLVQSLDTQAGPGDLDPEGRRLLVSDGGTIELWELVTPNASSLPTMP